MARATAQRSNLNRRYKPFPVHVRHWFAVLFVLSVVVFLSLFSLLSLQQEKQHDRIIMASALSASRILASNKPYIIYGTAWKKDKTSRLVSEAVHSGFRFIDTACQPKHYDERGVGDGWSGAAHELGLTRSDFYLQTKFTSASGQDPLRVPYDVKASLEEQVEQSLKTSLLNLRTKYLDALVLHSPMRSHDDTMRVWRKFESFADDGRVLKLGVSNCYDVAEFAKIYDEARIRPSVLQNRFHPDSDFDTELRRFCKDRGVTYQSFWTLTANRRALATPEIEALAQSKGLTPETLMYAFVMTLGHVPLSGTTNKAHMAQDAALVRRMQGGEKIFKNEEEVRRMARMLGMPDL